MEKLRNDELGISILKGACNSEATDLAMELGEIGMNALLDDCILKEIPVLKSIIACRKTWEAIHDQLFLRKVAGFLTACPKFTDAEKDTFARDHLSDRKKTSRLGDALVLILDKLDDLEKPELLAKAFTALVRGRISLENFRRLGAAIDIGFIEDLRALANETRRLREVTELHLPNLVRTGLAEINVRVDTSHAKVDGSGYSLVFRISVLGRLFIGCMNEEYEFKILDQ